MKKIAIFVLGLVLCSGIANAETKDAENTQGSGPGLEGDCDLSGWKGVTGDGSVFDATVVLLGPVATEGTDAILDVALELDIAQTWVGDLKFELFYDVDCDGTPDVGPVAALCRPDLAGCDDTGCCGCSGDIAGIYTFADAGGAALGEGGGCLDFMAGGCYGVAPESPGGFAETFGGLAKGGCWWLRAVDGAAGDETVLNSWTVYMNNGATPTIESTWGAVKKVYAAN